MELTMDQHWVEGFDVSTRECCLAALSSDILQRVARVVSAAGIPTDGLVEQVTSMGPLPEPWLAITRKCEEQAFPDAALHVARYLLLNTLLRKYFDRLPSLAVPPDVKYLLCDEFRFIAEPESNSLYVFTPGSYALRSLCMCVTLRRFPAGQVQFEQGGFPRSYLLKVPREDAGKLAWHVFVRMGGRKPYYMPHNSPRRKYATVFVEKEQRRSLVRIAKTLELNPQIKGYMGEGWLQPPNLGEASPHLAWMMKINRELIDLGALFTNTGPSPEDAGFLVGDRRRIEAYKSKRWAPLHGVLIAPRETFIEWGRQQANRL
jgi:hypothetical protein